MAQQYKQQSGRSMWANEIQLIKQGFEAVGPSVHRNKAEALERSRELTGNTHYGHTVIITSDHLTEVYAKPKD